MHYKAELSTVKQTEAIYFIAVFCSFVGKHMKPQCSWDVTLTHAVSMYDPHSKKTKAGHQGV
jgi:hypothetical protein